MHGPVGHKGRGDAKRRVWVGPFDSLGVLCGVTQSLRAPPRNVLLCSVPHTRNLGIRFQHRLAWYAVFMNGTRSMHLTTRRKCSCSSPHPIAVCAPAPPAPPPLPSSPAHLQRPHGYQDHLVVCPEGRRCEADGLGRVATSPTTRQALNEGDLGQQRQNAHPSGGGRGGEGKRRGPVSGSHTLQEGWGGGSRCGGGRTMPFLLAAARTTSRSARSSSGPAQVPGHGGLQALCNARLRDPGTFDIRTAERAVRRPASVA